MKHILLIITAVMLSALAAKAQAEVEFSSMQLDSLTQEYLRSNLEMSTLDGYRIQIYSGSGTKAKSEALTAKLKFNEAFPLEKVYVVYNAPFWRVRTGDFRFRSEALPLLERVKRQFPGSYTVRDNTVRKKTFK